MRSYKMAPSWFIQEKIVQEIINDAGFYSAKEVQDILNATYTEYYFKWQQVYTALECLARKKKILSRKYGEKRRYGVRYIFRKERKES